MPETIEVTLYRFDEFSATAKARARAIYRERDLPRDWYADSRRFDRA